MSDGRFVRPFQNCSRGDVAIVGGKNASLGEMTQTLTGEGIRVPPGFATTADAFRQFLTDNGLDAPIKERLKALSDGEATLAQTGLAIRELILKARWPQEMADAILAAYRDLARAMGTDDIAVAVRSSATAEDLPDASFAGQQETYLNVVGDRALLDAARACYASLFTDRAISYREAKGFEHEKVALSVGVQVMVRSDTGGSGVMFSIDPESGFDKVVVINAAWGLGETVVQGVVDPDEYAVFKPLLGTDGKVPIVEKARGKKAVKMIYGADGKGTRTVPTSRRERSQFVLSDDEIMTLARWAMRIETHYATPMDIEWARDGEDGPLFIVQARPETVRSREDQGVLSQYSVEGEGKVLVEGLAVGAAAVTGEVCLIEDVADLERFVDGSILVTRITDPDWVPIMKRAAGIITDHGGRTSHAAIVSRELGLPAIVGTGDATERLHTGQSITLSCAGGDVGAVFEGAATITRSTVELASLEETRTKVMLNMANPGA
ncbi:MAG: phosphoenolpyruvate synthase, partial [Pseudomonadota bacterium]